MKVEITSIAQKQLGQLPPSQAKKIAKKLQLLVLNPYLGKKLKGPLKEKYSLRAWPFRIIYVVEKNKHRVVVDVIEHRQGAYK